MCIRDRDGLDRADRLTGTTVDALIGVDVESALTLVDAVDRAFLDTGLVLDVNTRLGDHVRHVRLLVWIVGGPVSGKLGPGGRRAGEAQAEGSSVGPVPAAATSMKATFNTKASVLNSRCENKGLESVSYTHLTLPTILRV